MIRMCLCRVTSCSKCTSPEQDIDSGEGCVFVRTGGTCELCIFCETKIALTKLTDFKKPKPEPMGKCKLWLRIVICSRFCTSFSPSTYPGMGFPTISPILPLASVFLFSYFFLLCQSPWNVDFLCDISASIQFPLKIPSYFSHAQ